MGKNTLAMLAAFAFMIIIQAATVYANQDIRFNINGKETEFFKPPIIENDRLLVGVRALPELLQVTVQVDFGPSDPVIHITNDETSIEMTAGSLTAHINGNEITLDAPPRQIEGDMLVPIRFIGEALGFQVSWDADSKTVGLFLQK